MSGRPAGSRGLGTRLVLVIALVLGLAGAILLAPPPTSLGFQLLPSFTAPAAPGGIAAALLFGLLGAVVVVGLSRFFMSDESQYARRFGAVGAVALGIGVLFVYLLRLVKSGGGTAGNLTNGSKPPGPNTSCPMPTGCGGGGAPSTTPLPAVDGAVVYVLLIVVAIVVVLLYPRLESAIAGWQKPAPTPPALPPAPSELTDALDRLSRPRPDEDARQRIIRAYGELLRQVAAGHDNLAPETPREIASDLTARYGVRPTTAREITALFEEARYSRGAPMDATAVDRAEVALRRAIEESTAARRRRR